MSERITTITIKARDSWIESRLADTLTIINVLEDMDPDRGAQIEFAMAAAKRLYAMVESFKTEPVEEQETVTTGDHLGTI